MRSWVWKYMDVIPVHFSTVHKDMLAHCKIKLEKELVAVNPRFKLESATYSNSESTVLAYASIFETLRIQAELKNDQKRS